MRNRAIAYVVGLLIRTIDPQDVKELIDDLLDNVEDKYASNLPVIQVVNLVRMTLSIPDDIGGDED